MSQAERVTIGDVEFIARPLTVREIIDIVEQADADKQPLVLKDKATTKETADFKKRQREQLEHNVIAMLFEDCLDPRAFLKSLQCPFSKVDHLTPEEMKRLMEAVAKANPTYAEMEKKAVKILDLLRSKSSDLPSA